MKKIIIVAILMLLYSNQLVAQQDEVDFEFFNHLGFGVSIGSDGIGIDLASPITDFAAIRAGLSFWPKLKQTKTVSIKDNNPSVADNVDIQGKLNIFDIRLLVDIYPFIKPFHITTGFYWGKEELLSFTNTTMFIKDPAKYGKLGITLGDHRICTDEMGNIHANTKINSLKPYIGLGYGHAVPKSRRMSVSFDLGVQLWGEPGVYALTVDDWGNKNYHKFTYDELDEQDDKTIRDALETISKLKVLPILNIRITGRLF